MMLTAHRPATLPSSKTASQMGVCRARAAGRRGVRQRLHAAVGVAAAQPEADGAGAGCSHRRRLSGHRARRRRRHHHPGTALP